MTRQEAIRHLQKIGVPPSMVADCSNEELHSFCETYCKVDVKLAEMAKVQRFLEESEDFIRAARACPKEIVRAFLRSPKLTARAFLDSHSL